MENISGQPCPKCVDDSLSGKDVREIQRERKNIDILRIIDDAVGLLQKNSNVTYLISSKMNETGVVERIVIELEKK